MASEAQTNRQDDPSEGEQPEGREGRATPAQGHPPWCGAGAGDLELLGHHLVARYLVLALGVLINSFGIALITKARWAPRPSRARPMC